jgi:glyoxylase-like metal-dependent hydrolase (beta-lactamase superfamily II)
MRSTEATSGWYRFQLGDFTLTVVSDGPLPIAPATRGFIDVPDESVIQGLHDAFLPTDRLLLAQNALVVDTGHRRVLIDTGTGNSQQLNIRARVPQGGRLLAHMRDAGIDPASIDIVALTHPHFDHCWGLSADDGTRNFPNAQLAISEADLAFWTDETRMIPGRAGEPSPTAGAILNIRPYSDRLVMVRDGQDVVPGITALATPGHTIGHHAYRISSGGESLIHFGDVVHHHILLLRHPHWRIAFDTDGALAVETRQRLLDELATDRALAMGYHTPWPGLGHVARRGEAYEWVQVPILV